MVIGLVLPWLSTDLALMLCVGGHGLLAWAQSRVADFVLGRCGGC